MIKRIIPLIILLLLSLSFALPQFSYADSWTDKNGYLRNGKVEEWDRTSKGYYNDRNERDELEMGHSWKEQMKIDEGWESNSFYKDGTPKPGTFMTPEEEAEHEKHLQELKEERYAAYKAREDAEAAKKARLNKQGVMYRTWLYIISFILYCAIMIKICYFDKKEAKENWFILALHFIYYTLLAAILIALLVDHEPVTLVAGFWAQFLLSKYINHIKEKKSNNKIADEEPETKPTEYVNLLKLSKEEKLAYLKRQREERRRKLKERETNK